ncbi:TPA: protein kinase [Staphylococcus aureus]
MNEEILREVADIFIGDDRDSIYDYKTGNELVRFFNHYFNKGDIYQAPFPSRWLYVVKHLQTLIQERKINQFFTLILSNHYIKYELKIDEVEAAKQAAKALKLFNKRLNHYGYYITGNNNARYFMDKDEDTESIGYGGYANIYLQKSTGLAVKKLKEEYLTDSSIKSRFKREFDLTKSFDTNPLFINVFEFNESDYSYTMELADETLKDYIESKTISELEKVKIIMKILKAMSQAHSENKIHRDISSKNVLMFRGKVKISDLGLGKNLDEIHSHQTFDTNGVGQYKYCAPEQMYSLKQADKQSDVFSLGRLINFIMTGNVVNNHHLFRGVSDKATNSSKEYRFEDANEMLKMLQRILEYHSSAKHVEKCQEKLKRGVFDDESEEFIMTRSDEQLCQMVLSSNNNEQACLIRYMQKNESSACDLIESINRKYQEFCGRFEDYDPFAKLAYMILCNNFSYRVNETAARVLNYVAWSVNRFSAQDLIKGLINRGVEPLIEEKLKDN